MVKIKVCGITNKEDALLAEELGVDFIGVITEVPVDTPRKLNRENAREILDAVASPPSKVMVVMPEHRKEPLKLLESVKPDFVQFHGEESPKYLRAFRSLSEVNIIKTIHVTDESTIKKARRYLPYVDAILLDTATDSGAGGSGIVHDWDIARKVVESIPKPVILAGGLTPENVQEAIEKVNPYAVDVSSGVEYSPGKKDPEKLRLFAKRARNADK